MNAEPILEARRAARTLKASRDAELSSLHEWVAIALKSDVEAPAIIEKASAMLNLWEAQRTCSPLYIEEWRKVLADSHQELDRRVLRSDAPFGLALMHNTPFGFLLRNHPTRRTE
jgi:hypothetical protein